MKKLLLTLFILLAIFSANHSYALSTYSIVDLGDFAASAINNNGVVVGTVDLDRTPIWYDSTSDAFKWENGQTTILQFPPDNIEYAGANSINDKNEIVGYVISPMHEYSVMWDSENTAHNLHLEGEGRDINEHSQVAIEIWAGGVSEAGSL